jgi:iron complex outermembrane receptor protein
MFGPNNLFPGGRRTEKQQRERWGGAIGVSGDFAEDSLVGQWLPENTTYAFSAYYNQYQQESTRPDWIVSRLQNALNGYGGPDCQAIDRVPTVYTRIPDRSEFAAGAAGTTAFNAAVAAANQAYDSTVGIQSDTAPGTNGCQYFNPFASSFQTSFINGAANPASGGAAFENSEALLRWLTHDRQFETTNSALTFNATFTGEIPNYELPGGAISWAVGSEWRQTETRGRPLGSQDEIEIAGLRCPWDDDMGLAPTFTGLNACYADRGPFFSSGLGAQRPTSADRQVLSFYGELQFPILENLNVQLAGRTEDYGPVRGDIWKIAAKYDVLSDLSFRASYSTNFQAPPDDLGASGIQQGTAYVGSLFRSVSTRTITADGITPEDDSAANVGVIWSPEVFGGQLRMGFDLWQIVIDKEVGDTALANVFQSVYGTTSPTSTSLARCNAAFIGLVTFTETCNDTAAATDPARTTGADLLNVTRFTLNTGGFITSGFDFSVDYTRDLGPGEIYLSISGTDVMAYKVKGYNLPDGTEYQADFDGLAWANLTRGGTIMPRWRANGTIGYALGAHRGNLRANYISGFRDDTGNFTGQTTVVGRVGTTNIFPRYGISPKEYLDFDFNYIYTAPFWQDLEVRLSVLNIFDKDPMPAQHTNAAGVAQDSRTGYYPGYGNPRGRQIEIGVTKKF